MHFDFLKFIYESRNVIIILLAVAVLYILLNKLFKNKKSETSEEENEEKYKTKKGYSEQTSTYMTEAKDYGFIPRDGSRAVVQNYNRRTTVKSKKQKLSSILEKREEKFQEVFYNIAETNLSKAAKILQISNDELVDNLKAYKKNNKFLDVSVDVLNDEIIYTNNLDRTDDVLYVESTPQESKEEPSSMLFPHKCPFCNTDNVIDNKTKKYNCYYCLKEVNVK